MLLFRSEEHVDRWCERHSTTRGGLLTPDQLWRLADAWYRDRMSREWRRRIPDESQAMFNELGLTGPFWELQPAG